MIADSGKTPASKSPEERPEDEYANLATHALGFALSLIGCYVLLFQAVKNAPTKVVVACAVYSGSLVGLYAASSLSHMFYDLAWRRFFRTLDQVFIYLLIAGSFTPIAVVFLWNWWGKLLLVMMWGFALLGVLLVLRVKHLSPLAMTTYGLLGWLPAVSLKTLYEVAPFEILIWIIAGGLFYSVGTLFLTFDWYARFFHAMWHTFVIAGSVCHFIAILLAVL